MKGIGFSLVLKYYRGIWLKEVVKTEENLRMGCFWTQD
jgi:hypothetical protein